MQLRVIKPNDIPYSSDSELSRSIDNLTRKLRETGHNWRMSRNETMKEKGLFLETELCYLQREVMWRKKRELIHKEYMKNIKRY